MCATREAVDILNIIYGFKKYDEVEPNLRGTQEQRKRWVKIRYASLPLFLRPVLYFTWRYFFKLGFLDGKPGLVWHFLQGGWYRFLVDAKINEINHRVKCYGLCATREEKKKAILEILKTEYGIKF